MKTFSKTILAVMASLVVAGVVHAQTTTINWNFTDLDANFDSGTPVNFSISALTAVNSSLAINTTSPSSGYTGASGGGNAAVSAVAGAFSLTTSTYFSFTLTPSAGYAINSISFSVGSRSTTSGPIVLTLRSSADGFASNLGTSAAPTDSSWNLYSYTYNSTGANNAPVEFRLYGSGGSSTASNWRIDDLNITAQAVAIPEPSVYMLLGVGLLFCGQRFLRGRKSA